MEIRFPIIDGPDYMPEIAFSRVGDSIIVKIAGRRNEEKARYEIDVLRFNQMTDMLLCDVPSGIDPPMQQDTVLTSPLRDPPPWCPPSKDF